MQSTGRQPRVVHTPGPQARVAPESASLLAGARQPARTGGRLGARARKDVSRVWTASPTGGAAPLSASLTWRPSSQGFNSVRADAREPVVCTAGARPATIIATRASAGPECRLRGALVCVSECPRALLQTASNRRLPRKLLAAAKQCLFSGQGPTPRHAPSVPRPPGVHATPLPLSGGQPRPSGRALHGCSCAQLAARPQPLSSVCHGGGAVAAGRQASRGGCGPIPSHVILGRPHEQGGGLPGGPAGQEVWCVPSERPLRLRPAPPSLRAQPPRPSLS